MRKVAAFLPSLSRRHTRQDRKNSSQRSLQHVLAEKNTQQCSAGVAERPSSTEAPSIVSCLLPKDSAKFSSDTHATVASLCATLAVDGVLSWLFYALLGPLFLRVILALDFS